MGKSKLPGLVKELCTEQRRQRLENAETRRPELLWSKLFTWSLASIVR
jgi:hypothetical protein